MSILLKTIAGLAFQSIALCGFAQPVSQVVIKGKVLHPDKDHIEISTGNPIEPKLVLPLDADNYFERSIPVKQVQNFTVFINGLPVR